MAHDSSTQNPYRKVSFCTWTDEKVARLSPLQPSGQALFLMLLVGPQTTHIPGVQPIGRMAFAEMLGWEIEAFDEAFKEAYREGLAVADWKARLVFVPNAIKHNLPQSPNVIKSWSSTWLRIPACSLKVQAWNTIYNVLLEKGEAFAEAFKAACPLSLGATDSESVKDTGKATGKPSDNPTDKDTDNQKAVSSKKEVKEKTLCDESHEATLKSRLMDDFDRFWYAFDDKRGRKEAETTWLKLNPSQELVEQILESAGKYAAYRNAKLIPSGQTPKMAQGWLSGRRWEDAIPDLREKIANTPIVRQEHGGTTTEWMRNGEQIVHHFQTSTQKHFWSVGNHQTTQPYWLEKEGWKWSESDGWRKAA